MQQKLNERAWAGQLISWIQEEIREGRTIFKMPLMTQEYILLSPITTLTSDRYISKPFV
jgi:hypothetical protein